MAFAPQGHWVWDFWLADDGETYHLFYLHAPKSLGDPNLRHRNARISHATSSDLRTWTEHGIALGPGSPGDFDDSATWTGCVVLGPDGVWRMFYTGTRFLDPLTHANIETIGMATSTDLYTWTKCPGPLLSADSRWYETLGTSSWPEEAWRDPWVYPDPQGNGWHMLITARSNHGDEVDRGVVGHAISTDLDTWEATPPLSLPGSGFKHLEVLQVIDTSAGARILFSCDTNGLAGGRAARGEAGGIWLLAAPSAVGPVDPSGAMLLADQMLYAGRIVTDRHGDKVLLAFHNVGADGKFQGTFADPIPLRADLSRIEQMKTTELGVLR